MASFWDSGETFFKSVACSFHRHGIHPCIIAFLFPGILINVCLFKEDILFSISSSHGFKDLCGNLRP